MREFFEENKRHGADQPGRAQSPDQVDWARLEEVGDLHFYASSFSAALDYYRQILENRVFAQLPLLHALGLLRKAIDANVQLGRFDQFEQYINMAMDIISRSPDAGADPEVRVQKAIFQVRQAVVFRERGQLQESLHIFKSAFSVLALTDEHTDVASLQAGMGLVHYRLGRLEKAEEFFNDSLATSRRIGDEMGVARQLNNLALLYKNRCQWDKAQSLMEKVLEIGHRTGATHFLVGRYLKDRKSVV